MHFCTFLLCLYEITNKSLQEGDDRRPGRPEGQEDYLDAHEIQEDVPDDQKAREDYELLGSHPSLILETYWASHASYATTLLTIIME